MQHVAIYIELKPVYRCSTYRNVKMLVVISMIKITETPGGRYMDPHLSILTLVSAPCRPEAWVLRFLSWRAAMLGLASCPGLAYRSLVPYIAEQRNKRSDSKMEFKQRSQHFPSTSC